MKLRTAAGLLGFCAVLLVGAQAASFSHDPLHADHAGGNGCAACAVIHSKSSDAGVHLSWSPSTPAVVERVDFPASDNLPQGTTFTFPPRGPPARG